MKHLPNTGNISLLKMGGTINKPLPQVLIDPGKPAKRPCL